jgi:hypothetical protein
MASVAGLAPARFRWKDGVRDLLCIHGRKAERSDGVLESWSVGGGTHAERRFHHAIPPSLHYPIRSGGP